VPYGRIETALEALEHFGVERIALGFATELIARGEDE